MYNECNHSDLELDMEQIVSGIRGLPEPEHRDFLLACWDGDVSTVRKMLQGNSSLVNCTEQTCDLTPLHLAAWNNHPNVIQELLRCSELNDVQFDKKCRTPVDLSLHNLPQWGEAEKHSCFNRLVEDVETKAWRIVEKEKQKQHSRGGGWELADFKKVLKYLFSEVTDEMITEGADFLCFFEYGGHYPATLFLIGKAAYFCCDRLEQQFGTKTGHETMVLRMGMDLWYFQHAEPQVLCIILMKASSEWFQRTNQDTVSEKELETFLHTKLGDDTRNTIKSVQMGQRIVTVIKDELEKTREKVELCFNSINSLSEIERRFTCHKAAVAFLRFLETFALQDFFQEGFTEGQRKFLSRRKKALFERFLPDKTITVIRKVREILFDRANFSKKRVSAGKLPRLFSCEEAFRYFQPASADAAVFFAGLLKFTAEALDVLEGKRDGNAWETDLLDVFLDPSCFAQPQLDVGTILSTQAKRSDDFEKQFLENSKEYVIKFDDPDVRHCMRYELEFDLIVNIRALPSLCSGEMLQRRNKAAHCRSQYTLMTEDIASCLFDYYRRRVSEGVFETLKKFSRRNKIEHELQQVLDKKNQEFSSIAMWYTFSNTKCLALSERSDKAILSIGPDITSPEVIDLYLRCMARLLVEERFCIRDAYTNMTGTEKAELLQNFKEERQSSVAEILQRKLGLEDDDIDKFIELSKSETLIWYQSISENVLNTLSTLQNVRDLTKAFNTSWQDMADLYAAFVHGKGNCTFLNYFPPLKELEHRHSEGVRERVKSLPNPGMKVELPMPLSQGMGSAALSDIVGDLLTLVKGTHIKTKLILEQPKSLFSDPRVVDYIVKRCLTGPERLNEHRNNENFFLDPLEGETESNITKLAMSEPVKKVLKSSCEIDFMTPLAARLVSLIPKGKELPSSFHLLVPRILSTDSHCPLIDSWSTCDLASKIFSHLLNSLQTDATSPDAIVNAVLKGAIQVARSFTLPSNAVPAKAFHQALSLMYDLIEQEKIEDAKVLLEIMECPDAEVREQDFCKAWLQISEASIIKINAGKNIDKETKKHVDDLLSGSLRHIWKNTQQDKALHGMVALRLNVYVFESLSNAVANGDNIHKLYETVFCELWAFIKEDIQGSTAQVPPFSAFVAATKSSKRYQELLSTNHFCRRLFNIFNLKSSQVYNLNRMARECPGLRATRKSRYLTAAEHCYELLREECQSGWSTRKFGALRAPMRLGHVHKQLAWICKGSESFYHLTKALEIFMLLRLKLIHISGALSPHTKETVNQLEKLLFQSSKIKQQASTYPVPLLHRAAVN